MPTLTVFLAPDGPAAGVLDVLTDLSAAALVDDFLWVGDADVPTGHQRAGRIPAVAVRRGVRTPTTIDSTMKAGSYGRRRLCVIVPLTGPPTPVSTDVEQRLRSLLEFAGGHATFTPIRLIVACPDDYAPSEQLNHSGWHNIYVVPENARGPAEAHELLDPSADVVEIGKLAAPAIAGIVGLWAGNDRTPLDDAYPPNGVRAGRAFYRRIDASPVENELRRRVLSTDPLPVPRDRMIRAIPFSEPRGPSRAMAEGWWQTHREALVGQMQTPEPVRPHEVGALALLKLLLRFIGSQLSTRPEAWWAGLKTRIGALTAKVVHDTALGAGDKGYSVIVRGRNEHGLPEGWRALGAATGRLDDQLAAAGYVGHDVRPNLRSAWDEFAGGAMALADGGRHGSVPPLSEDRVNPSVLRSTADAAPPPGRSFTIPGPLQAGLGEKVLPGDVLGAEVLRRRLRAIERQDAVTADETGAALHDLNAWQEAHRHTYSTQVGERIAYTLLDTIEQIKENLQWLREHAEEHAEEEPEPSRFVKWMTRLLMLLAVAALIAAPILEYKGVLTPVRAVLLGFLPLLVLIVFVVTAFVHEQRQIFRILLKRRKLDSELTARKANLRQSAINARRLTEAYEQYLVWSQVVGAVINNPFGPLPTAADGATMISYGLPDTTRIAQVEPVEHAIGAAATMLRSRLYNTGWMGRRWDRHLRGAGRQIGRYDLMGDDWEGILDLRGGVAGSALEQWSERLGEGHISPDVGEETWREVMGWLYEQQNEPFRESLLSAVRSVDHDLPEDITTFLAGIDRDLSALPQPPAFDGVHFTSEGQRSQRTRVDAKGHHPMSARIGLSRIEVLVQLSEACPEWEYAVTEQRNAGVPTTPTPIPAFPTSFAPPQDDPHSGVARRTTAVPEPPQGYS